MRFPIYSLLSSALLTLLLSSLGAAHSSSTNSHARRSLSDSSKNVVHKRLDIPAFLGDAINDVNDSILGDNPDKPSSSDASSDASATTATTTTSSSDKETTAQTTSSSASDESSTTSKSVSPTIPPTSEPTNTHEIPTSTPTTKSSNTGILGTGILGGLTSVLPPLSISLPVTGTPIAIGTPSTSDTTSAAPSTAPTDPTITSSPSPTNSDASSAVTSDVPTTSVQSTTPSDVTSSATALPSTTPVDPLSSILSDVTSALTSVISGVLTPSLPLTSILDPTSVSSSLPDTTVSTTDSGPTSSSSSSDAGPTSSSLSVSDPVSTSSSSGTGPTTSSSVSDTGPTTSSSSSDAGPTSVSSSSNGITSIPSETISSTSSSVVISFPSSIDESSSAITTTDAPAPSTTISINSDLSFILTESSLALTSIASTSAQTFTDPDQPTTTLDNQASSPATTLSVAPLPTGIPARIYPRDQLDLTQNLSNYTLISILFDQELNWPFVVQNQISSSQIFGYLPIILATALQISNAEVKTWALQVYVPSSYRSAQDKQQLGTTWLGYIPSDMVDTLASQIKAKQSAFYTGTPDHVAQALASHVNSGFNLNSVPDPNNGGLGADPGLSGSGAASDSGKSRQDAIIGVVSALGAVALLVLVFLVYRSLKRRRELAHRRLSDVPDAGGYVAGARPEGREFDQDSVGGARRRSFYYAEDSLRGFQGNRNEEGQFDSRTSPQMGQRRNVMPSAISAPILQQSSMNW